VFDGIIDLVYVSLGLAYFCKLPFNEGWQRVHWANMKKVRAERPEDSKRGSTYDIIKPEGWEAPKLSDLL
jgi:predicted HAD superfamily Cof-like phosphohydrolase